MAFLGRNITITTDSGLVMGMRSKSVSITHESVDISTEDDTWRQLMGSTGLAAISFSGTAVFQSDAGMQELEDASLSGSSVNITIAFENGDTIAGSFIVASFESEGAMRDAHLASITLEGAAQADIDIGTCVLTEGVTLEASDKQSGDAYGYSIDISHDGQVLAIGAPFEDSLAGNAGKVYIYDLVGSSWVERNTLTNGAVSDFFGSGVGLSGDGAVLAVGADAEDSGGTQAGIVYIYEWNGSSWSLRDTLNDGTTGDRYGASVDLSQDGLTLVVGARGDDTAGTDAGIVYTYTYNGAAWSQLNTVVPHDPDDKELFGRVVALSGDGQVLASRLRDQTTTEGYIYVYDLVDGAWVFRNSLKPNDYNSRSVVLSQDGSSIVIGSADPSTSIGYVQVLEWNDISWVLKTTTNHTDTVSGDSFGIDCACDSEAGIVIVGASNAGGSTEGRAYSFTYSCT